MGSLKLPPSGAVYLDANCVIYAVEKIKPFAEVLEPLWRATASGSISILSSQLALLEVMVKPIREKKIELVGAFRAFLLESEEFRLVPIDLRIIERAARIRAETALKTPDAIHAATALETGAALFVTGEKRGFRKVTGLTVEILKEALPR